MQVLACRERRGLSVPCTVGVNEVMNDAASWVDDAPSFNAYCEWSFIMYSEASERKKPSL